MTNRIICEWFALCDHEAIGTVSHPVLGEVPCCRRCVDKLDMQEDLTLFDQGAPMRND